VTLRNPACHTAAQSKQSLHQHDLAAVTNLYDAASASLPASILPGGKGWTVWLGEGFVNLPPDRAGGGLFDWAPLWQAGFRNVTCSMGTCLNATQIRSVAGRSLTHRLFGFRLRRQWRRATGRLSVAQRLWAHGVEAFPVELPQGHDPNSFFAHGGGDAYQFQELLRKASA